LRTLDLIRRYFDEQFFIIPLLQSSKIPFEKKWNEKPLSYTDTLDYLRLGYNIGIVGGYQSRKDDMDLIILDFDGRLGGRITDNIEKWRNINTLVQFTPHGFHIFLRTKATNREDIQFLAEQYIRELKLKEIKLHRTTYDPKHQDNTFDKPISKEEHNSYFESLRWNSMYVVACPSKVGNKSYWFLDDMKQEILII
jgi:hypothetical protein